MLSELRLDLLHGSESFLSILKYSESEHLPTFWNLKNFQIKKLKEVADLSASAVIRQYLSSDLDACRKLWLELTEWHRSIYEDQSIGGERANLFFDKHLEKVGATRLWVLELDLKVIGLIGLEYVGEELFIEPLVIDSKYRGRGYGTALIEKIVNEAKIMGETSLSVKPVARNQQAIKFFFNRGFSNLGHIQLFMHFKKKWRNGPRFFDCNFKF